jgi:hypothetical protein
VFEVVMVALYGVTILLFILGFVVAMRGGGERKDVS